MEKMILVKLADHPTAYPLEEDAYELLQRYLDLARSRLRADPDGDEVIRDIERSIGDRLTFVMRRGRGQVGRTDMQWILEDVGAVDPGEPVQAPPRSDLFRLRGRVLCRIREDQWLAGVCTGLAAYSEVDVGWVRTIFILLGLVTGGLILLPYLVLMFALPVLPSHAEYAAQQGAPTG